MWCFISPDYIRLSIAPSTPTMMTLATGIFFFLLMSLALYLYLVGAFSLSSLKGIQFVFYILLIFIALTIGIGIEQFLRYVRPSGDPVPAE